MDNQDGNGTASVLLSSGNMLSQRPIGYTLPVSAVQSLPPLRPILTGEGGVELVSKRPRMVVPQLGLSSSGPELAVDTNIGLKKVINVIKS